MKRQQKHNLRLKALHCSLLQHVHVVKYEEKYAKIGLERMENGSPYNKNSSKLKDDKG